MLGRGSRGCRRAARRTSPPPAGSRKNRETDLSIQVHATGYGPDVDSAKLAILREQAGGVAGGPAWCFSVEEILSVDSSTGWVRRKLGASHERHHRGFGSLDDLVAFLRDQLADGQDGTWPRQNRTSV